MPKRWVLSWFTIFMSLLFFAGPVYSKQDLAQKVRDAIPNYYERGFDVSLVNGNTIQIDGDVNTLYDKYRIFDIISKVHGVKAIINNLAVDAPIVTDKTIQDNIEEEMHLVSSILEPDRITVKVKNGIAYLGGVASYYREKKMMETLTSWQKGVVGIHNDIKILPPSVAKSDDNLTIILNQILKNDYPVEDNLKFTVHDGIVYLTGSVTTLWIQNHIQEDFARVLGVKGVVNNTEVEPIT